MINEDDEREYRNDLRTGTRMARSTIWRAAGLILLIAVIGFATTMLLRPAALVTKVTDPDKMISNYEEFQEIWNTCQKLDADLQTICATPDGDAMFAQFSKGAMVAAKRQQMTRWTNEYNAKSKMITRRFWKSGDLPYQLSEQNFPHYNCK